MKKLLVLSLLFLGISYWSGCEKDCSKNYQGEFSLSDSAKLWLPAPTEQAYRMYSNIGQQDSFSVSQSTTGPVYSNTVDEQECVSYDGQEYMINFQGDSTGFNFYSSVRSTHKREVLHMGVDDFALNVDLKDRQIVGLETDIPNINGEVHTFDTVSFGSVMYFDVIRIDVLDPGNETGFTQWHWAKGVGYVQFVRLPGIEWVRQ